MNFDFAAVKTYQWEDSNEALSLDQQRFRAAVASHLAKQSYQEAAVGRTPDLKVRLQVTNEPRQVRQMPAMGWRGFWGRYRAVSALTTSCCGMWWICSGRVTIG